ncbi:MAG TPA: PRC-barrel domain-containing protein [Longimicrobiales bacterium]|nr:PRC-barrel domain-containing protein [Longimicrobiales bacterium]
MELAALSNMPDYRVSGSDTDPRGWNVVDANEVALGNTEDLIIDVNGLQARYIVCSISRGAQRSVLIPVGFAWLDAEQSIVHLDFVTLADVDKLPTYGGLPLSPEFEAEQERAVTGAKPEAPPAKIVRRNT